MTFGIAAYKVTPGFCEAEVDYILSLGGIRICYGCELGRDITLDELCSGYDAVFLGFGVGLARKLDIPGETLNGVVDAIDFIHAIRDKGFSSVPVGDRVAVIGMGMTAIDAATQARRLGATEVTLVYRRTHAEMPCTEAELDLAKMDGCQLLWLAAPKEILGYYGHVTSLVCHKMELGTPDASGRRYPVDTGETVTLDVDMVIKAAGQLPYTAMVANTALTHDRGRIAVTGTATNLPGVFAGGDCVNGGKEVVDAVQAGKDAAAAILNYLNV